MASLVREIVVLIDGLLVELKKVALLGARMKTLRKILQGIRSKVSQFKMAELPAELLLKLESRLYELGPILRHLHFNKDGDEIEKIQMIAQCRDEIGSFDAAMGRLHRDIGFLGVHEEGDQMHKLMSGRRREMDTDKDAKEIVKYLRALFAQQKELPGITEKQQELSRRVKTVMKDNEVSMYKTGEFLGKISPALLELANATVDVLDETIFEKDVAVSSRINGREASSTAIDSNHHLVTGDDEIMGYGFFGPVVRSTFENKHVVLRPLPRKERLSLRARAEIRSHLLNWKDHLHHENIVRLYSVLIQNIQWRLVLEACDQTLFDVLHTPLQGETHLTAPLDPTRRNWILRGVIRGLEFLHSHNVLHQNLKPDNILLISKRPYVKLSSFGMASIRDEVSKMTQSQEKLFKTFRDKLNEGHPDGYTETDHRKNYLPYQAPEIFQSSNNWTPFSDVYSFALIAWEATQIDLFPYTGHADLARSVGQDEVRPVWGDEPYEQNPKSDAVKQKNSKIIQPLANNLEARPIDKTGSFLGDAPQVKRKSEINAPEWLKKLVEKCWDPQPFRRPRSEEVANIFEVSFLVEQGMMPNAVNVNGDLAVRKKLGEAGQESSSNQLDNSQRSGSKKKGVLSRMRESVQRGSNHPKPKHFSVPKPGTDGNETLPLPKGARSPGKPLKAHRLIAEIEQWEQEEILVEPKLKELLDLFKKDVAERNAMNTHLQHKHEHAISGDAAFPSANKNVSDIESKTRFIETLTLVMENFPSNVAVQSTSLCLLRLAVQSEEDVKICGNAGVGTIVCEAMDSHQEDSITQLFGILILGNLALGSYSLRKKLIKDGAPDRILTAMITYKDAPLVQAHGCWTIANFLREKEINVLRKQIKQSRQNSPVESEQRISAATGVGYSIDPEDLMRQQTDLQQKMIVKQSFLTGEFIDVILAGMEKFEEKVEMQVYGFGALFNILNTDINMADVLLQKGILALVQDRLGAFKREAQIQEYGVNIYGKLFLRGGLTEEMIENDVIRSIVGAIASDPSSSRIRYAAWKCFEMIVGYPQCIKAVITLMRDEISNISTVVIGSMILKFCADSIKSGEDSHVRNTFIETNTVEFLVSELIPAHLDSKQAVLEAVLALHSIVDTVMMIRLDLLIDLNAYTVFPPSAIKNIGQKLQLGESELARMFCDKNGFNLLKTILKKYRDHVSVIEACVSLFERMVNVGIKDELDLFQYGNLEFRNALHKSESTTEILILMVNHSNYVSLLAKGLSVLCELAKWEELGRRDILLNTILDSDLTQVSSKFAKGLITDEEFIKIRALAAKPTTEGRYSVDQKRMAHRVLGKRLGMDTSLLDNPQGKQQKVDSALLGLGALDVITVAVQKHKSNPLIQELALETLTYLAFDDYGRNEILQKGGAQLVSSILDSFSHYPGVITMAFLLSERLYCCTGCKADHLQYLQMYGNKSPGDPKLLFIWDDEEFAPTFKCMNKCYSLVDPNMVQTIAKLMMANINNTNLMRAGSLCLRAFGFASNSALDLIRNHAVGSPDLAPHLSWVLTANAQLYTTSRISNRSGHIRTLSTHISRKFKSIRNVSTLGVLRKKTRKGSLSSDNSV